MGDFWFGLICIDLVYVINIRFYIEREVRGEVVLNKDYEVWIMDMWVYNGE